MVFFIVFGAEFRLVLCFHVVTMASSVQSRLPIAPSLGVAGKIDY